METINIQYYVVQISPGSGERSALRHRVESLLRRVLPTANPDFEDSYHDVRHWWLETDDNWLVHRELGFDERGEAIVAGPVSNNPGVFTDQPGTPFRIDDTVEPSRFEEVWQEFMARR